MAEEEEERHSKPKREREREKNMYSYTTFQVSDRQLTLLDLPEGN